MPPIFALPSLMGVVASGNRIKRLGRYTFTNLPNLIYVDLQNGILEEIHRNAFDGTFKEFSNFVLSHNNLQTLGGFYEFHQ